MLQRLIICKSSTWLRYVSFLGMLIGCIVASANRQRDSFSTYATPLVFPWTNSKHKPFPVKPLFLTTFFPSYKRKIYVDEKRTNRPFKYMFKTSQPSTQPRTKTLAILASTRFTEERIGKARTAFLLLRPVWRSKEISLRTKLRIFNTNVKSVFMYGAETWRVTNMT